LINDHDLHIRRLQWEFEQRQTQQQQCDEVEKSKETILSEIQEESRILQSILPMLKDIRTVSFYFIIILFIIYLSVSKINIKNKRFYKLKALCRILMYQNYIVIPEYNLFYL